MWFCPKIGQLNEGCIAGDCNEAIDENLFSRILVQRSMLCNSFGRKREPLSLY